MPTLATTPARRSYEAAILLVVLDDEARAVLAGRPSHDLEAVDVLDDLTGLVSALEGPGGTDDPDRAGPSSGLETRVHTADIVVLLVGDLATADTRAALAVCDTARAVGRPCAVVAVGAAGPDGVDHSPPADRTAVLLREAVDTLVAVRDPDLALGFVDVLRGGSRDEVPENDHHHREARR